MSQVEPSQRPRTLIPIFTGEPLQKRLSCVMRWYSPAAGYGFALATEGDDEVMVHSCVLARDGFLSVAEGAVLDVEAIKTVKGLQALMIYAVDLTADRSDVLARRERTVAKHVLTVRWYNEVKGFGFCTCPALEGDVFLHAEALKRANVAPPREGETITALVAPSERGLAVRTVYAS